ncbi:gas vesicle protein GvpH [Halorussus halophilus]|uniref:gas vesicle protein GvpH n=1 Tax=Halorussus halophilus TaxID=2650975 RepID=UPI0017880397|nr:gas vesicle protein GvpH [Halorussus halophilus]
MSHAPDDPHEPHDETTPSDRGKSAFGLRDGFRAFTDLLRVLDDAVEGEKKGRVESDRTTLDYGVSVGAAPDDRTKRRTRGSVKRRKRRTNERYHVTARREDDVFVVTADLPGVEEDELTVGFDDERETLVVAVEGRVVERVTVPWSDPTAEQSTLRNGVLEVRLDREDERA